MGSPYQSQAASGYNANPPPDDGSTVAANQLTWAKHKTKLADPIKTLADAINTALRSALDVSPITTSIAYTTLVGDHLKTVEATGTFTVSLGDAATMIADTVGYTVTVFNKGTGLITVGVITATDTLNGTANGTLVLPPQTGATFTVAQSGVGYNVISTTATGSVVAATASVAAHATTCNPWIARAIVLTGAAVTFTDITDAPYAGAVVWIKQNAAHVWTDGAVFNVQGGANYTAAADDWIRLYATTVSTFEVTVFKASAFYDPAAVVVTGAVVGAASQDVFNTVSTTVNAFGAATTLTIGGATNAGKLVCANYLAHLSVNSSDTADNGEVRLDSTGGLGPTRGAYIRLFGNENGGTGGIVIAAGNVSGGDISFRIGNGATKVKITQGANVVLNAIGGALGTTATDGFTYLPTCAGTPTGAPTAFTGAAPAIIDTTNHKLYFYSGGSWRDAGP